MNTTTKKTRQWLWFAGLWAAGLAAAALLALAARRIMGWFYG